MVIVLPHEISRFCNLESVSLVLGKFLQHLCYPDCWSVVCGIAMSSFSTVRVSSKRNEILNGASYSLGWKFLKVSLTRIINN